MKGLIKLLLLLAVIFCVSSIFKGGDYVRSIGDSMGMNLEAVADIADGFRLDTFMAEKKGQVQQKERSKLGN